MNLIKLLWNHWWKSSLERFLFHELNTEHDCVSRILLRGWVISTGSRLVIGLDEFFARFFLLNITLKCSGLDCHWLIFRRETIRLKSTTDLRLWYLIWPSLSFKWFSFQSRSNFFICYQCVNQYDEHILESSLARWFQFEDENKICSSSKSTTVRMNSARWPVILLMHHSLRCLDN